MIQPKRFSYPTDSINFPRYLPSFADNLEKSESTGNRKPRNDPTKRTLYNQVALFNLLYDVN